MYALELCVTSLLYLYMVGVVQGIGVTWRWGITFSGARGNRK